MPLSVTLHCEMVFSNFEGPEELVVAFGRTWFSVGTGFGETLSARAPVASKPLFFIGEILWDCDGGTDLALAFVTSPLLEGPMGMLPPDMGVSGVKGRPLFLMGVGGFGSSTWRAVLLS